MENKMSFINIVFVIMALGVSLTLGGDFSYIPPNGFVPDSTTATKIAEAIWLPIYGSKIENEKPYNAKLMNDSIWVVNGTLHTVKGGTAYAEIRKKDGCVMKVSHGK